MIKLWDYILITNEQSAHYLEIGYITDINYDYDGSVKQYRVDFRDNAIYYNYTLEENCMVLMFKPR